MVNTSELPKNAALLVVPCRGRWRGSVAERSDVDIALDILAIVRPAVKETLRDPEAGLFDGEVQLLLKNCSSLAATITQDGLSGKLGLVSAVSGGFARVQLDEARS